MKKRFPIENENIGAYHARWEPTFHKATTFALLLFYSRYQTVVLVLRLEII
jgi:hypothetical protein